MLGVVWLGLVGCVAGKKPVEAAATAESMEAVLTLQFVHTNGIYEATVLEDGRVLSWSEDHTLRTWDGDSGQSLSVLEGHTKGVWGATLLEDGRVLSWSHDATLRTWDLDSGEALSLLEGHTRWVGGATVLDDGRFDRIWRPQSKEGGAVDGFR